MTIIIPNKECKQDSAWGWQLYHLYIVAKAQNVLIILIINKVLET